MSSHESRKVELITLLHGHFPTQQIPDIVRRLEIMGFFDAPASTKYHGNYIGGLFDHSINVTQSLVSLTHNLNLEWDRPSSPYIIGLFHDLCKCDNYKPEIGGDGFTYNNDTLFKGHGVKSVMLAATIMPMTEEEITCITYHMGAFTDKSEWSDYTHAIHLYPNVLYTHTADMIAAHIVEVD